MSKISVREFTALSDEQLRAALLDEIRSLVPQKPIELADDFENDLRLLSDDGTALILALEKRYGVKFPQSRLDGVATVGDLAELLIEFRNRRSDPALDADIGEAERTWIEGGPIRPKRPLILLEKIERILGFLGMGLGAVFLCGAVFLFVEFGPEQKAFWIMIFLALGVFVCSASLLARK